MQKISAGDKKSTINVIATMILLFSVANNFAMSLYEERQQCTSAISVEPAVINNTSPASDTSDNFFSYTGPLNSPLSFKEFRPFENPVIAATLNAYNPINSLQNQPLESPAYCNKNATLAFLLNQPNVDHSLIALYDFSCKIFYGHKHRKATFKKILFSPDGEFLQCMTANPSMVVLLRYDTTIKKYAYYCEYRNTVYLASTQQGFFIATDRQETIEAQFLLGQQNTLVLSGTLPQQIIIDYSSKFLALYFDRLFECTINFNSGNQLVINRNDRATICILDLANKTLKNLMHPLSEITIKYLDNKVIAFLKQDQLNFWHFTTSEIFKHTIPPVRSHECAPGILAIKTRTINPNPQNGLFIFNLQNPSTTHFSMRTDLFRPKRIIDFKLSPHGCLLALVIATLFKYTIQLWDLKSKKCIVKKVISADRPTIFFNESSNHFFYMHKNSIYRLDLSNIKTLW